MKKILLLLLFVLNIVVLNAQEFSDPSRTETKNDAGQSGTKSGFFQANNPVNFPQGAGGWWHLLDVRHSSSGNNYAMQFSGSFFDQELYFRKTSDKATQPWRKVMTTDVSGNLGIGVNNPVERLQVQGATRALKVNPDFMGRTYIFPTNETNHLSPLSLQASDMEFKIGDTYYLAMSITNDGRVGIGVAAPPTGYKLAVAGNIIAEQVRVQLQSSGWPDYVFKPQYQLMPLSQVENFIKEKGHLPEIPSAEAVAKEGVELGTNQALLLKKIEEMTLHLISINKRVESLEAENRLLKKQLEKPALK